MTKKTHIEGSEKRNFFYIFLLTPPVRQSLGPDVNTVSCKVSMTRGEQN